MSASSSGKSSTQKSEQLLDRYLQAVRFWLPRAQQADIIAELSEDLRSQIEEKESELGCPLDDSGISAILKRCGRPMVVASRFQRQRHLIGPALFPMYRFVLKVVLLWIQLPLFAFIIGPINVVNSGDWGVGIVRTLFGLWMAACIAAGTITVVFAALEGTQSSLNLEDKWDPRSLPPIVKHDPGRSPLKAICEAVFAVVGLVWLLLLPNHLVLILGPAAAFLQPAPLWHRFYIPILFLACVAIARPCIALAKPQWSWFPALSQLLNTGLTLVLLYFILHAALPVPAIGWSPFVMVTDAAKDSTQYKKLAGIVNASILLSLAATWIGLAIASIVQIFELGRQLRQRTCAGSHPMASHTA
jgi:hypothetical protein